MKFNLKAIVATMAISAVSIFTAGCNPVDNVKGWVDQIFCKHETTEIVEAVAPTCTEDGYTEYERCVDCGKEVVKGAVIEATGHTIEVTKGYAATCETMGLTDKKTCSVCEEVLEEAKRIPVLGHKKKDVKEQAATCTEDGHTAGVICENGCGTIYSGYETIPAGHTYEGDRCTACGAGISAAELKEGASYTNYTVRLKYDAATTESKLRSVFGYYDGEFALAFDDVEGEDIFVGVGLVIEEDSFSCELFCSGLYEDYDTEIVILSGLSDHVEDFGLIYIPNSNKVSGFTKAQLDVLYDIIEFIGPESGSI